MGAIVVAGVTSGVGKTTVTTGLMGALRRRGFKVQPFKTGPDYIDPMYHTWVTGEPSRNLDTWLLSREAVIELFSRAMKGKDMAVIEGVMGLYDGRSALGEEGSTAELAKILGAPVLLVVESQKAARSLAAMVTGYKAFDPAVRIAGVILNGIGSSQHFEMCAQSIEQCTGTPVVGYLPRKEELTLPERHLGLVPTVEGAVNDDFLAKLIAQCEATFDIVTIVRLAEQVQTPQVEPALFPVKRQPKRAMIGLAQDRAFSFYYQDTLDLLEAWGAELAPFSPLRDSALPRGVCGLYIGGGFPELYAAGLAENISLKTAIRQAFRQGMPVYGECGGLMYLGAALRDFEGKVHDMVGAIPVSSQIASPRLSLGYRTVQALNDGPLLKKGETVRGHEFHWSVLENTSMDANAYRIIDKNNRLEGFQVRNLLVSYVHLHMGSLPSMVGRFIDSCERFHNGQGGA
jgi:cobyrinic acid a,c-diamide synthase